jgi:hypothetical protein
MSGAVCLHLHFGGPFGAINVGPEHFLRTLH